MNLEQLLQLFDASLPVQVLEQEVLIWPEAEVPHCDRIFDHILRLALVDLSLDHEVRPHPNSDRILFGNRTHSWSGTSA